MSIAVNFDIKEYTDINSLQKERYGQHPQTQKLLTIDELTALAKKYNTDFEIQWVYNFELNQSVAHSFIMHMDDHMYSAFIISEF